MHFRRLESKLLQIEEASDEFKFILNIRQKFLRTENKTTHKLYILFYFLYFKVYIIEEKK